MRSNGTASAGAYFEPRYNATDTLQLYAGIAGQSISFANRAAAEIDFYGGVRPTFGPLALDLGFIYYYYPNGECYAGATDGFDWDVEGVRQTGDGVSAWAASADFGYALASAPLRPRFGLRFDAGSGDGDPADGRTTGFFPLFPSGP